MSNDLLDIVSSSLVPRNIGIEEFAESSEYCNRPLFPRQTALLKLIFLEELTGSEEDILDEWIGSGTSNEVLLSPSIRERVEYLRERGYKHFREVQLVGGRRSSKGFLTGIAMAKVMWDTLQLGDPRQHYGIKSPQIFFSCIAASESQAKEFQYADFAGTIEGCRAFDPYLVRSLETEFRVATQTDLRSISAAKARGNKIQRDLAMLRGKALAANAGTLRGSTTMIITMDEMAWMIPGESKASAEQVYQAAIPSLAQFGVDGMIFLNSSPYTKVGKFYDVFEIGMRPFNPHGVISLGPNTGEGENSDPRMMTFEFPSWELFKGYIRYKSRWKQRTRGKELGKMPTVSPDWDPDEVDAEGPLYSPEDRQNIVGQRVEEGKNPEAFRVEQRAQFAEVIDAFLNPLMVDQMYAGLPVGTEPNPDGSMQKVFQPFYTNYGDGASYNYRYKFHLDPSSNTAGFGFSIAHIEFFPNLNSGDEEEHVVFDMIKRWDPKVFGGVIRWKSILQEVMLYADIFRPYEITFDQHQSLEPSQELQEMLRSRNIMTQVYEKTATNELNWKRWQVLKTAIYQGLVHAPCDESLQNDPTCQTELKFLQEMPTGGKFPKVEKQDIGPVRTKDQADCAAECVYSLIGTLMITHMRDRLSHSLVGGGQHGYGIGQGGPIGGPGPRGISGYYSTRKDKVIEMGMDRSNLTRSALGGRGIRRGQRSRGRY